MINPKNLDFAYPQGIKHMGDIEDYMCFRCNVTGQLVIFHKGSYWPTSQYDEVNTSKFGHNGTWGSNKKNFLTCILLLSQRRGAEIKAKLHNAIQL